MLYTLYTYIVVTMVRGMDGIPMQLWSFTVLKIYTRPIGLLDFKLSYTYLLQPSGLYVIVAWESYPSGARHIIDFG